MHPGRFSHLSLCVWCSRECRDKGESPLPTRHSAIYNHVPAGCPRYPEHTSHYLCKTYIHIYIQSTYTQVRRRSEQHAREHIGLKLGGARSGQAHSTASCRIFLGAECAQNPHTAWSFVHTHARKLAQRERPQLHQTRLCLLALLLGVVVRVPRHHQLVGFRGRRARVFAAHAFGNAPLPITQDAREAERGGNDQVRRDKVRTGGGEAKQARSRAGDKT